MPLTSNPDAFYLDEGEFGERFGFERPRARQKSRLQPQPQPHKEDGETKQEDRGGKEEHGKEANPSSAVDEVIFYCHAGVRSRAAARMAREWKGVRVGDMRGGWAEWEGRGGEVER